MTEQEQIKAMTEKMKRCFEKNGLLNFKWFAEALVQAGYGDISGYEAEREMLGSQIKVLKQRLNDKYIEIDNLNRDYSNAFERLKSQQQEIERLKAENETYCKQINQAYDTGYDDGYESCQDDIKKSDELLKEYEK